MTARRLTQAHSQHVEPSTTRSRRARDPLATARQHVAGAALAESAGGRVGLELEFHLVDLAHPERRPPGRRPASWPSAIGPLPSGSLVTLEPGGQIELSTPARRRTWSRAVAALRADREVLRTQLLRGGLRRRTRWGPTSPARSRAINPSPRYLAMEQHFDALGYAGSGKAMMSATAALQVNLDAGPGAAAGRTGWR